MSDRRDEAVCWLHLGDQHLTAREDPNFSDMRALVSQVRAQFSAVDFVYLPGDVAEHGTREEYALAREALADLRATVYAVPGDHDMASGDTAGFRALFPRALPSTVGIAGRKCLFVDVVSAGAGGPDFRLGAAQLNWLTSEVRDAKGGALVFMHVYPDELADETERRALVDLFGEHDVLTVDMGHTHYNELANDGATIFAATRSIGQIEEGPPGLSLMSVDSDGAVSWRFKPLAQEGPVVMISSPADRRLTTRFSPLVRPGQPFPVRALAFPAEAVAECRFRIGEGAWRPMQRVSDRLWSASAEAPQGPFRLAVEARLGNGASERDKIDVDPSSEWKPKAQARRGSDVHALGAWPERHIHGGQLGPNRNGRKW